MLFFMFIYFVKSFQGAEESELPVASNAGPENTERTTVPADFVPASPSVQLPSAAAAQSTLMADNAATIASLRMVYLMAGLPLVIYPTLIQTPFCFLPQCAKDFFFFKNFFGRSFIYCLSDYTSTSFDNLQLRVYLRTYALDQMIQAASSSAGLRTIKRVEQTLQELGVCVL